MKIKFKESVNLENSITNLNKNKVSTTACNTNVNELKTEIATVAKNDKNYTDTTVNNLKTNEIAAIQKIIDTLTGGKAVTETIQAQIDDAIKNLIDGAPTAYDTLKNLLDYINKEGKSFNDLITQLNSKIQTYVGKVDTDYSSLEKIENIIKNLQTKHDNDIATLKSLIGKVNNNVPLYKYESLLPINEANKIVISETALNNMLMKGRVEVVTIDKDDKGNIIDMMIIGYYTVNYDTTTNDGKTYIIESQDSLKGSYANVEYFANK